MNKRANLTKSFRLHVVSGSPIWQSKPNKEQNGSAQFPSLYYAVMAPT